MLLLILVAVSFGVFLLFRSAETTLLYPRPPANTTFPHEPATLIRIPSKDSKAEVPVLFHPARESRPTIVTFHGNGEQLSNFTSWIHALRAAGFGAMVVEYPGYGLSTGPTPSEPAIYANADLALSHLRDVLKVPDDRVVLLGESLGTGVAVEMARRGYGKGLILISPYSSIPDMAEVVFPWLPVSSLLRNRYDNADKARRIDIPTIVLHGTEDRLIPMKMGQDLSRRFRCGSFVPLQEIGHGGLVSVYSEEILGHVGPWLESTGELSKD